MADGKKKITVEKMISPFAETKTKKPPLWFANRPKVMKDIAPFSFRETLELDERKWKKKDIEDGIYAVARYELAMFATQLAQLEKPILKEVQKHKAYKNKLPKSEKEETPELKAELNKAEKEVVKLFKAIAKKVEDKVSIALEDIENDKGDNKKALAAGKEAIKRFDSLDTSKMFTAPTTLVVGALGKLAKGLQAAQDDSKRDAAYKAALQTLKAAETSFEKTGKVTEKVVKYLLHAGEKMAKDKKSAQALQDLGKLLSNGTMKKKMGGLVETIEAFEFDLDDAVHFAAAGTGDVNDVTNLAKTFGNKHKGDDRAVADAVKEVAKFSKAFKAVAKDLK